MDLTFVPTIIPRDYAYYAERSAVMRPVARPSRLDDAGVIHSFNVILEKWRSRVNDLQQLGWREANNRSLQYLRNCRPACAVFDTIKPDGSLTSPRYACGLEYICPWCWARRTRDLYRRFEALVPDTAKKPNLYTIELSKFHFAGGWGDKVLDAVLFKLSHDQANYLTKLKPVCAFRLTTLESRNVRVKGFKLRKPIWFFKNRMLVLYPPGETMPMLDEELTRTVNAFEGVSRHALYRAVAWCMRYPSSLLSGDPSRVMRVLEARRGLRLSCVTGTLRAQGLGEDARSNRKSQK